MPTTNSLSSYHHRDERSSQVQRTISKRSLNIDHTISFLTHYWIVFLQQHPWMHRLAIFLDNATSTNKNRYWAMEMVSSGKIDHVHISFMMQGILSLHLIGSSQLLGVLTRQLMCLQLTTSKHCDRSASTYVEKGDQVFTWRECLGDKYSDLPGIKKFHDFLIVKCHDGNVVMKVRDWCFKGAWKPSPLHVHKFSKEPQPPPLNHTAFPQKASKQGYHV